jgi:four helix bundle protein
MFSHEKLIVYQDCLALIADIGSLVAEFDGKHSFATHLPEAAESSAINLVEACREASLAAKEIAIDYSLGSVLECAACLDIGVTKSVVTQEAAIALKLRLRLIFGKLIGLRKSWRQQGVAESMPDYDATPRTGGAIFHHESLEIYKASLEVLQALLAHAVFDKVGNRAARRVDELSTTIILNVAEGNGRFHSLDHARFLKTVNKAAFRLAVLLDVAVAERVLEGQDTHAAKQTLAGIARMSASMAGLV